MACLSIWASKKPRMMQGFESLVRQLFKLLKCHYVSGVIA